ncbi:MAG TPA: FAD-dependent oxidoreductase [Candidatus Saccharibacteria bacterium]|nr:FAD-dependent oxidoreductase [Candidatus Saccharibacteria bacterium]
MTLKFVKKQNEVGDVWSFFFESLEPVNFVAGQYLNLTMPSVPPAVADRLFTIASAPDEPLLQFTTIIGPSDFKQKLNSLIAGEEAEADQLGGDFMYDIPNCVIPTRVEGSDKLIKSRSLDKLEMTKRLFIAGGIGITPYLSMIRDLIYKKQPINATLLYAGKNEKRPFVEELNNAVKIDPTLIIKEYSETRLTLEQLKKDVPNVEHYIVYLAGSQAFSEAIGEGLIADGFPRQQIKYDYFDGYVDLEY